MKINLVALLAFLAYNDPSHVKGDNVRRTSSSSIMRRVKDEKRFAERRFAETKKVPSYSP